MVCWWLGFRVGDVTVEFANSIELTLYNREELCGGYLADAYSLLPIIKEVAIGIAGAKYRPGAIT